MTLKGRIKSTSIVVPLYASVEDVPAGVTVYGLETEGVGSLSSKAIEKAAADFGVDKAKVVVFSTGREGAAFVVSCGIQVGTGEETA